MRLVLGRGGRVGGWWCGLGFGARDFDRWLCLQYQVPCTHSLAHTRNESRLDE